MICQPCSATNYGNTGAAKAPIMKAIRGLFLVPLYDSTGARNKIDLSVEITDAYISARINDTDKSKRWAPVMNLKNITSERAESIFQEFEDGTKTKIRTGTRPFEGLYPNASFTLINKFDAWGCKEFGVYIVDDCEALIADSKGFNDGFAYPIEVDAATWEALAAIATDSTVTNAMIKFDFAKTVKDGNLLVITDVSASLLATKGLIDVYAKYSSISTTGYTIELYTDYGVGADNVKVSGLTSADFFDTVGGTANRLYNVTDSLAVTPTSIIETVVGESGIYVVVMPAQTSADKIRNTPQKNGFDFSEVIKSLVTIP